jgi:hypothetical protein
MLIMFLPAIFLRAYFDDLMALSPQPIPVLKQPSKPTVIMME